MTVAELIAILQTMPQDAKVILAVSTHGKFDNELRDVIYNDPKFVRIPDAGTVELDHWPPLEQKQ